ncbi:MAG: type II secretion system secretin GspD [Deltaproteobacteria bacterium]|nr:type II secretion system secretin GspD [Deltaproteobacteria bacterium]
MIKRSRSLRRPWPKGHLSFGQWPFGQLLIIFVSMLSITLIGSSAYAAKLAEKGFEEETRQVTMDFRDVEIGTLVKFIGEMTGKNFIIDERVKGKITVISPTKISVPEAYKVFESILEVHGYTTVPSGKVIKVMPATEARGKSITTTVGTKILPSADTMITQVVPIQYANVNDVKALFTPLVSKESLLVSYQPTNTLIVTDALSNINRLLKILKEIDVPGYAFDLAVIPLQNAAAETVARELKTLFEGKTTSSTPTPRPRGEEADAGAREGFKVIPDERTNALIVMASPQSIDMLKGIIAKLDQEVPRGKGNIHVYYLQNAVAEDLAKILMGVAKEAGEGAKGGATAVKAPVSSLGEKISVLADKTTNALIITASSQDYAVIEEVIKKLDIARAQVYVEALIAEVTLEKMTQIGVQWNWTAQPKEGSFRPFGGTDFSMPDALTDAAVSGLLLGVSKGFVGSSSMPDLKGLLQLFTGDSDVNVLSAPRLLTTDNQEAQIIVGEERPFLKSSQLSEGGSTLQTWDYKDVGITLKLTPHISKGTLLRLDIFAEIKSFVEDVKGLEGASVTTKRQATTSVVVEDGSTVVIAGLIRDDRTGSLSKVPILGDIPLLGWLFKSRSQNKTKTNLLIFITPRIVISAEDLRKITEEEQEHRQKNIEEHRLEKKKTFPLFEDGD